MNVNANKEKPSPVRLCRQILNGLRGLSQAGLAKVSNAQLVSWQILKLYNLGLASPTAKAVPCLRKTLDVLLAVIAREKRES